MINAICPVCKTKMPDTITGPLAKVYECPYCKAALKVSVSYTVSCFLTFFLGSYLGQTLIDFIKLKNMGIQKWVANPLIIGLSMGLAIFLLNLLYPRKLALAEVKK
ncbi:MAG TPA: hypothetical protein VHT96_09870 [Clostridia bacterium]|nr:hypothetical protein [Clostridia bacterium]